MPYMIVGTAISAVAAGLLVTLGLNTSTAYSTTFMFLAGVGAGIGGNQPFIALQAALTYVNCSYDEPQLTGSLSEEDLPLGNGLTVFGLQLGT
jgi:hypothetical protein